MRKKKQPTTHKEISTETTTMDNMSSVELLLYLHEFNYTLFQNTDIFFLG